MSYEFRNITVLIVESSETMFGLTKDVLRTFGVNQIYAAFDVREGFRTFCRIKPDLVITDWMIEPETGMTLTKMIRNDPASPNPFIPIIMMTGHSQKKRVIMARDSGITEFLVKPFTAKSLYQRIEQLIEKPRLFVKSDSYFGPDRRRKREGAYAGPERRTDEQPVPKAPSAARKAREIMDRKKDKKE